MHVTTHEGGGRYQCLSLHMRVEGGISACHYTYEGGGRYQCLSLHT